MGLRHNPCIAALVATVLATAAGGTAARGADEPAPLTTDQLRAYCLLKQELPPDYGLIADAELIQDLGMLANPDYVTAPGDTTPLARQGGTASFLAIYGRDNHPRLLLRGIWFRRAEACREFVERQRRQPRQVAAFRRESAEGTWLFLAAIDPALPYSDEEQAALRDGLDRYCQRLNLTRCFHALASAPTS